MSSGVLAGHRVRDVRADDFTHDFTRHVAGFPAKPVCRRASSSKVVDTIGETA
jgi:hypothetical protein